MLRLGAGVAAAALIIVFVMFFGSWAFAAPQMCGLASYYGQESGSRTANGERFTGRDMTAASRTLPFGTKLRVTYQGRSAVVRINDRGPYVKGRFLDLSKAAAERLGMIPAGVAKVCVDKLK